MFIKMRINNLMFMLDFLFNMKNIRPDFFHIGYGRAASTFIQEKIFKNHLK